MKSKDLQNIVLSKCKKYESLTEIHRHLSGAISLATIKTWCQMVGQSATSYMYCSTESQGTKENIQKVKKHLHRKQGISSKTFEGTTVTSVRRILKINLGLKPYKR